MTPESAGTSPAARAAGASPAATLRERQRAVFFDRDGTLNVDFGYISSPQQLTLAPNAAAGARMLADAGYLLIVVSNQSGIARGLYTEAQADAVDERLGTLLASQGAPITAFYRCPHLPGAPLAAFDRDCECRKPKPGLLLAAANDYNLDLASSWAIGDRARDVAAGLAAGARTVVVDGVPLRPEEDFSDAPPLYRARDLVDAARFIIEHS